MTTELKSVNHDGKVCRYRKSGRAVVDEMAIQKFGWSIEQELQVISKLPNPEIRSLYETAT